MNRAHGSPPDSIPASYYARPAGAPRSSGAPSWRRWAAGFRGWSHRKRALAAAGCATGAVCVALTPWRPALGLVGVLVLACVVLATDAWGLRGRVPLLRATSTARVTGGWGLLGGLLLLSLVLAVRAPGSPSPAAAHAARQTPPPASGPAALAGVATASPVAPTTTPSPQPTPTPTVAPRRSPTASPPPVTFLNPPLWSPGGQFVTVSVRTSPLTACSIAVGYQPAPTLDPATSSGTGDVSWTWKVSRQAPTGTWPITVTCGRGTATTQIVLP